MATVFERLQLYCSQPPELPQLTHQEKANLGRKIIRRYFSLNYNEDQFNHCKSVEPEGEFKVLNYPESFTHEIDLIIIQEYLMKMRHQKQRKRIPPKPPKPDFSAKPSMGQIDGQP